MPVSRLRAAFASVRGRTGLIPFATAGYPTLEGSHEILLGLADAGVLAIEMGIPFSDPIADGPEIQRASEVALAQGVGVDHVLELVRAVRARSEVPIVLMTYANPILRRGIEHFAENARAAGADGVLISDLPPEESPETWYALDRVGLDTIVLTAPTTEPLRLARLVERARGFVYCLARTGVTGAGPGEAHGLRERVAAVRRLTSLPVAVGFGVSTAAQARALKGVADGVVVGAAFMRAVATDVRQGATERVLGLAGELVEALR